MTKDKARNKAKELAKRTGETAYVCSIDSGDGRTFVAVTDAGLDDEFDAFDGSVCEIINPDGSVE